MPQASALSLIMHLRSREACTLSQPQNTNHHTHRLDLGQTLGRCRGCGCRLRRPPVALFWCSAPPALRSSRRQRPNFFLVKNCLVFAPPFVPPNMFPPEKNKDSEAYCWRRSGFFWRMRASLGLACAQATTLAAQVFGKGNPRSRAGRTSP